MHVFASVLLCVDAPRVPALNLSYIPQQIAGAFGRKSWKLRWCALVPNALLTFGTDSRPKPGAVAKGMFLFACMLQVWVCVWARIHRRECTFCVCVCVCV